MRGLRSGQATVTSCIIVDRTLGLRPSEHNARGLNVGRESVIVLRSG